MKRRIDPELLRDRLSVAQGRKYWRSLDELADDPAVVEMLEREFPDNASEWTDLPSRRRFLTLMGASLALAGVGGCAMQLPTEKIVPYVRQPENIVLGKPLYYATTMPLSGSGVGLLVESHEGRPTKIEGNPLHPASKGATDLFAQASVLDLYDPDRAKAITNRGQVRTWGNLIDLLRQRLDGHEGNTTIAILTEAIASPTLAWQLAEFRRDRAVKDKGPAVDVKWVQYEPTALPGKEEGARIAFGRPFEVVLKIDEIEKQGRQPREPDKIPVLKADVIVALDADFLGRGPGHLAYTRAFSARRRNGGSETTLGLNRLYVIESTFSITGANADNRLAVRPIEVERFARALAAEVGVGGVSAPELSPEQQKWVKVIGADLKSCKSGATAIVVGEGQPANVHASAHLINDQLGNFDHSVQLLPPAHPDLKPDWTLAQLTEAVGKKAVDILLILGGNPAYTAPGDVPFADTLTKRLADDPKWLAIHLGSHFDETARLCHWHVPESHYLETWSDALAYDGTASVIQPLIAPLYTSRSAHEFFSALTRKKIGGSGGASKPVLDYDERPPYELVRAYWRDVRKVGQGNFERFWQESLHDGVIKGTAPTPLPLAKIREDLEMIGQAPSVDSEHFDVVILPDPTVYDGRFANNGWLQECPKPITKLTWDNAALMSPETAEKLGIRKARINTSWRGGPHGDSVDDMVRIELGGNRIEEMAVWLVPGHADNVITVHLGYGRTHSGQVANGTGVNVYPLRLTGTTAFSGGAQVTRLAGKSYRLACTQGHQDMAGRDPVRSEDLEKYKHDRFFATRTHEEQEEHRLHQKLGKEEHEEKAGKASPKRKYDLPTLYTDGTGKPAHTYPTYAWGMAVDLSACTGCSACVVACQAENNIPVVGKDQVSRGREMHWLRIDRYFQTPKDAIEPSKRLKLYFQPVMCQHCENAPCEVVCPVEATAHGEEGTNDMVYNRCVGTRYCANNCPYKVRRFNSLQFSDYATASLKLLRNPDVTVRTRGVMEKCSFCIQRISYARIEAAKEALDELSLPEEKRRRFDKDRLSADGKHVPVIFDGEVVTACQAACPAEAIVFGDLNDKNSRVHRLQESNLAYGLLAELGTRPRVAYLGSVRNPNPELEK